jgi:hypothetical protein
MEASTEAHVIDLHIRHFARDQRAMSRGQIPKNCTGNARVSKLGKGQGDLAVFAEARRIQQPLLSTARFS